MAVGNVVKVRAWSRARQACGTSRRCLSSLGLTSFSKLVNRALIRWIEGDSKIQQEMLERLGILNLYRLIERVDHFPITVFDPETEGKVGGSSQRFRSRMELEGVIDFTPTVTADVVRQ